MAKEIVKYIRIVILSCFVLFPVSAEAHPSPEIICPINCDQSRELFLGTPLLQGDDVKELQTALYELGIYKSPANGIFDSDTENAVLEFQRKYGLVADGRIKDSTWNVLSRAVEKSEPTSTNISPPSGEKVILIDTKRRTLTLIVNGEPFKQFPIACGKMETPTPIGNWKIKRKATNWGTGFGTRWMGLNVNWGIYGIHGTNKPYSIGGYQSHGCIRMHNRHVEQLYPWVSVGTPVVIVGNPFTYMDPPFSMMRRGDVGSAVMEVQSALKRLGYDMGVDGVWGGGMEKVIIQYRKDNNLPRDNSVDRNVYKSLGFRE
ncbi:MAG: L,D-transpeptidase family protein [Bacillota bacterium]